MRTKEPSLRSKVPSASMSVLHYCLAADASHPGETAITITTWQLDTHRVAVSVRDTGIGIDPSEFGQIFQPFYTAKSGVKGMGLCLSVSYGTMMKHHEPTQVTKSTGRRCKMYRPFADQRR